MVVNSKEQCQAITLRSGKQVKQYVPHSTVENNEELGETSSLESENVIEDHFTTEKAVPAVVVDPPVRTPYPQRLRKTSLDKHFSKFLWVLKKLHINIPFAEALEQMPSYVKFMKEILSKKRKMEDYETVALTEECSSILQRKLPQKLRDLGSFTIPCTIGNLDWKQALCDLEAVLDMEEDTDVPIIMGRPFLATGQARIDVQKEKPPVLELKTLPYHLRYIYLDESETLLVIVSAFLLDVVVEKLLRVLRAHKLAIGWTLEDIRGISPSTVMHKIRLEDESTPSIEAQRRLNPTLKEVVLPKKGGLTIVTSEKKELIPSRTVIGWRICIDYRKLNKATRKENLPLSFLDQMLDRLADHSYYCFLDGYSGYHQIAIAPEYQEKTTFTCPYGTFSFQRMPFGLCNAPTTFQRGVMDIFSDMVERTIKIFMDDFLVFGSSFDECLKHLEVVL
ncbi:uncharacterized protein LOC133825298 [Humulus lupulus]|uniref:uncharacterized protein LOC133825298 n=1 Tax=Humulus lupulus TaxID=3486 RepID=UPI002B4057A9|nr:uncharacterized protein LOC133825298 [Humulus lupulus]